MPSTLTRAISASSGIGSTTDARCTSTSQSSKQRLQLAARDVGTMELEAADAALRLAHVDRDEAVHLGRVAEHREQRLPDEAGSPGDGDRFHVHRLAAWQTRLNPTTNGATRRTTFPEFDLSKLFGDLDMAQLFHTLGAPGPVNWEIASQLAAQIATEGEAEPPIADTDRSQLEELAHAAADARRRRDGSGGHARGPGPRHAAPGVGRAPPHRALRPVLETLAATLGKVFDPEAMRGLFDQVDLTAVGLPDLGEGTPGEGNAEALAAMAPMLAPVLLGVQAGSMIGYLARHALGRYDLPLPTSDEPTLAFVVANLDEFEDGVVARARRPALLRRDPRGRARGDALGAVGARAARAAGDRLRGRVRARSRTTSTSVCATPASATSTRRTRRRSRSSRRIPKSCSARCAPITSR